MLEPPTIKRVLPYTALASVIFFITVFLGYIVADNNPTAAFATFNEFKTEQAMPITSLPQLSQTAVIIITNAMVGISLMLTGMIFVEWFGIFFGSIFDLIYNGFFLGKIIFIIVQATSWESLLWGMIAHAPFELTAIFMCAGTGFYVGYNGMLELCKGNFPINNIYRKLLLFYTKFVFPLFIIAGILEVYVTTAILRGL